MRISLVSTPQFSLLNFTCLNAVFLKYRISIWQVGRENTVLMWGRRYKQEKYW